MTKLEGIIEKLSGIADALYTTNALRGRQIMECIKELNSFSELEAQKLHLEDSLDNTKEDLQEMARALEIFERIRKEYI